MSDKLGLTNNKAAILIIITLIVLVLAIYWPVQNYEFINFDDHGYTTSNYLNEGRNSIVDIFTNKHMGHWHPVTMISHMLDWQLFGDRAGGHHWTNVIIHIFNVVLLFLFLHMVTGGMWRSAFVAALFAVHPINVESVAWIAERKNVLSTFFWILTMFFYVWYVKQPSWKRYLPIIFSFALGLMSKVMLVTLPFVLLLLDYWPLKRTMITLQNEDQSTAKVIPLKKEKLSFLVLEKVPLFVLSAAASLLALYAAALVKTISTLEVVPFSKRLANGIVSYGLYIKKLFWPSDLTIFYPFNYHIPYGYIILSALLLIAVTVFVCRYFRQFPYLPVGWFWYLGTLVPVIGIVQAGAQSMADRYAYVPFIGLFIMITWCANRLLVKVTYRKILFVIAAAVSILIFTGITCNQLKVWGNTVTLFEDGLRINPNNYVAYRTLGMEAYTRGDYNHALSYYVQSLKIHPRDESTYNNAGLLFVKMGRRYDAMKSFETALQINKFSAEAQHNLGLLFIEDNNLEKAVPYFMKAIEIKPDYADAHNDLGIAFVKQGRIQESILCFKKALSFRPNYETAKRNMKIAIDLQGKTTKR